MSRSFVILSHFSYLTTEFSQGRSIERPYGLRHTQGPSMLFIAIEAAKEAGKYLKYSVGKVKSIEMKKGEERNLVS